MNISSKDNNFLCIFNFRRNDEDFPLSLLKMCEDIFKHFGYSINKIRYSTETNEWSPTYERFKMLLSKNNYNYYSVSYYSGKKYSLDSNLFIDVTNYTRFEENNLRCKDLFTVSIVIKEPCLIDNVIDTYINITDIFSRCGTNEFSGFAHYFSKSYDSVCLAFGVLNGSQSYSYDMYNLTNWINDSSFKSGIIGYLGVFTNLSDYQISVLCDTLERENIYTLNNAVIYNCKNAILNGNPDMNNEDSFFVTSNYSELSRLFEHMLSYENVGYNYYPKIK